MGAKLTRRNYKTKKKGQILDILLFMGILFMVAVSGIIIMTIIGQVRTQFDEQIDVNNPILANESVNIIRNFEDRIPHLIDNMFMIVLVGVSIVLIVSSLFVRSHPVFFAFMIILMSFFTWVSAIYANTYQEISTNPDFTAYADKLKMSFYVMRYFPSFMLVFGILISVIMVAKE